MLKRTITCTDFNGNEIKEDCYFNLSESELIQMEGETEGGLATRLQRIVDSKNGPLIMKTFKDIILKSYGIKSDDGKYFRKSEEISRDFEQSPFYNELYIELLSDNKKAMNFIMQIMPKKIVDQIEANGETPATIAAKNM